MPPDQTVEIMRKLLIEAMLLASPMLAAAALVSLIVSLAQTLTGVQEQTLTVVPRLIIVAGIAVVILPWGVHRIVTYTMHLFVDLHRYLG